MKYSEYAYQFIRQLMLGLIGHVEAFRFLRAERPWRGIWRYRWAVMLLGGMALVVGLLFLSELVAFLQVAPEAVAAQGAVSEAGIGKSLPALEWEQFEWVMGNGYKYLVLIFLEILVFHVTRQTLELRTGIETDSSFRAFLHAEWRMIRVALRSWIGESITIILVNIALSVVLLGWLKGLASFFIQCYYIGLAFMDNYNEVYGDSISESIQNTRKVAGAAVAVGVVAYWLMYLPLVGVVLATLSGAVAATLVLLRLQPRPLPSASAPAETPPALGN